MGGKGSPAQPPSANWTSLAQLQLESQMRQMQNQSQLLVLQLQQQFQDQMESMKEENVLPPPPEITEYNIVWEEKIAELEETAYAAISNLTEWGEASGTVVTSPLVWDEEPNVTQNLLTGE